jgi:Ras-related protein Rab-23
MAATSMQEQDFDMTLKVIVVGNGCVGKTSMITRYAKGAMTDSYKKTIGTDFFEKEFTLKDSGETVKLFLWDTAGQEMFAKLTKAYYKGAGAVVYAFSTTDRESFLEVENWKRKVEEECGQIVSVLVQNKVDLIAEAKMTTDEVQALAQRMGVKLYRTCVKDNLLVSEVFEYLTETYIKLGGARNSGDKAVMDITDGSADHKAKAAAAAAANANGTGNGTTAATTAPATNAATDPNAANGAAATNKSFTLEPSTQRTGGKKSGCNCG